MTSKFSHFIIFCEFQLEYALLGTCMNKMSHIYVGACAWDLNQREKYLQRLAAVLKVMQRQVYTLEFSRIHAIQAGKSKANNVYGIALLIYESIYWLSELRRSC